MYFKSTWHKCRAKVKDRNWFGWILKQLVIVHGPESEIIPPGGIFVDPHIFVVWTLVFKNLVVGCKIDAG